MKMQPDMLSTSHTRNTMLAERRTMTAVRRMEILVALKLGKSPSEILKEKQYLNPSQVYSLRQKLVDADGDPAAVYLSLPHRQSPKPRRASGQAASAKRSKVAAKRGAGKKAAAVASRKTRKVRTAKATRARPSKQAAPKRKAAAPKATAKPKARATVASPQSVAGKRVAGKPRKAPAKSHTATARVTAKRK